MMYNDLGKVHGDNTQLGGTRNRSEEHVRMSSGKTTYGDHTRVGGTHNDRKSNKIQRYTICLINASLTIIIKPPRKSITALPPCPSYG